MDKAIYNPRKLAPGEVFDVFDLKSSIGASVITKLLSYKRRCQNCDSLIMPGEMGAQVVYDNKIQSKVWCYDCLSTSIDKNVQTALEKYKRHRRNIRLDEIKQIDLQER